MIANDAEGIPMHIRWHRDSQFLRITCLNCQSRAVLIRSAVDESAALKQFAVAHAECVYKP